MTAYLTRQAQHIHQTRRRDVRARARGKEPLMMLMMRRLAPPFTSFCSFFQTSDADSPFINLLPDLFVKYLVRDYQTLEIFLLTNSII